jgi:hypothetical protein
VRLDRLRCGAGLSPQELQRWRMLKRALGQHFSPGLSDECADQRESVRVPTRIAVSFPTQGECARGLMANLSRRGVFVRKEHPLEIGTCFELRIHVDDPRQDIAIRVEVVSHNVGPSYASRESGMGLLFLDAGAEAEKQLDELYERLVRRAPRTESALAGAACQPRCSNRAELEIFGLAIALACRVPVHCAVVWRISLRGRTARRI